MLVPAATVMNRASDGLATEVLGRFGEVRLRVTGTSMVPSVWPGDVVTIRRCAMTDVEAGQIVLATRDGRLFVHRVVAVRSPHLLIQGDALAFQDPPVSADQFLGRVESIARDGRLLDPPALNLARRTVSAIVRRSTRASRLLIVGDRLRRRLVFA